MTKQEALQKIEKLKQFVVDLDSKEQQLKHGDLVHYPGESLSKRVVFDTTYINPTDLEHRYLLVDEGGHIMNSFMKLSDSTIEYIRIGNVFNGK